MILNSCMKNSYSYMHRSRMLVVLLINIEYI
uniref:Uncharacterized protein n=1 Tax=Setaria italica TaxID=4555 RepID=K3Y475_SETIT